MGLAFEERVAPIRAWVAAYNAHDVRGLVAVAHGSIEITPMGPLMGPLMGTSFHGHVGVRTLMQWTFERFPAIRMDDVRLHDAGGSTLAESNFILDSEGPADSQRVWSLFDVEQGLIRRIRAYANHEEAYAAARKQTVLTPREREIFALLARGLTAIQIAELLYLSPLTVRTHIQNGKERLGARTRMEALSIALKRGEITV
ncbi:MAG TPA: LuxR C-terminal-related transcriptional regulator [Thermoleophilaceae bacterium]|jgi:DNA-binding CsgD family transcriptional regulator|nr:LuxR C-terminal-related transcriptional regulator [Thermoleophilaceae bacterium]